MSEKIQFLGRSRFASGTLRKNIRKSLVKICETHSFVIESLVYIHLTDEELLKLNQEHLNHDTYTDIITFDLSDKEGVIDGEIYISIDRVKENAQSFDCEFFTEYVRVASHGLLHLLGYGDKTTREAEKMREKEQEAIEIWQSLRST